MPCRLYIQHVRKRLASIPTAALALVLISAPQVQASHIKQIDMADAFNADVIVNGNTPLSIDDTQQSVDAGLTTFITRAAAQALPSCTDNPDGLPDDGRFPMTERHPLVDLAYDDGSNGRNAWRATNPDSVRVPVPQARYRAVHVFATAGDGEVEMRVKLLFTAGDPMTKTVTVPDWFGETELGYELLGDLDRGNEDGTQCYDDNGAALFGFRFSSDAQRKLKAVKVLRGDDEGSSVLTVYGMTGRQAGEH